MMFLSFGIDAFIVFGLFIILLLVLMIIKPWNWHRKVKIIVNQSVAFEVASGNTLLKTLAQKNIFLPSSCGGNGICGMCQCKVLEGGGKVHQPESNVLTKDEFAENWRLGCQVKVNENLIIELPDEIFGIREYNCTVISNRNVSTFIKEIVLKLPHSQSIKFKSGSYIQINTPKIEVDFASDIEVEGSFRSEWDKLNLWSLKMKNSKALIKPYSLANPPEEDNIVILNARISLPPFDVKTEKFSNVNPGISSSYLFSRKPGDSVTLSGPYGDFHIKQTDREMMFIGGGAGMAPMRSHLFHLFHSEKTNRKTSFWYGGRSKNDLFYQEEFMEIQSAFSNFSFNVALSEPKASDNWEGYKGFIHQVILENYLNQHKDPQLIEYYICGPPLMNSAVLKMLASLGVKDEMIAFDDFGS